MSLPLNILTIQRFKLHVFIAAASTLTGCLVACQRPAFDSAIRSRLDFGAVRVCTPATCASGLPLGFGFILTAAHVIEDGVSLVAVDGHPARVHAQGAFMPQDRSGKDDWALIYSPSIRARARVSPGIDLRIGDDVFVSGFPMEYLSYPNEIELLENESITIGGHITRLVSHAGGTVTVHANFPDIDYGGMSGGPAAVRVADGSIVAFGIVVDSYRDMHLAARGLQELRILQVPRCICSMLEGPSRKSGTLQIEKSIHRASVREIVQVEH